MPVPGDEASPVKGYFSCYALAVTFGHDNHCEKYHSTIPEAIRCLKEHDAKIKSDGGLGTARKIYPVTIWPAPMYTTITRDSDNPISPWSGLPLPRKVYQ